MRLHSGRGSGQMGLRAKTQISDFTMATRPQRAVLGAPENEHIRMSESWNRVNKAPIRKQGRSRWFGEVGYISEKGHFEPGFGTSRLFETICARNHLKMSDITASGGTQPLSCHLAHVDMAALEVESCSVS